VFTTTPNDYPDQGVSGVDSFGLTEYSAFLAFLIVDVGGGLQETWPRDPYRKVGEKA
jgi:hypothetical protein